MPVLHVLHMQQNRLYEFAVNLHLNFWLMFKTKHSVCILFARRQCSLWQTEIIQAEKMVEVKRKYKYIDFIIIRQAKQRL